MDEHGFTVKIDFEEKYFFLFFLFIFFYIFTFSAIFLP